MDIANNWTIVVGMATIVSMVLLWSREAYLNPILENETHLFEKVRDDINNIISNSNDIISKNGEEALAEELYNLATLKKYIRRAKFIFRHKMIPTGIGIILFTVLLVSLWEFMDKHISILIINGFVAYILLLLIVGLAATFKKMMRFENDVSRYLEGDNPSIIFENR